MARFVRFGRRKRRTRAPRLKRRRNTEQHPQMDVLHTTCFEAGLGHDVSIPLVQGQAHQSPELESLISLLRRVTREGIRAQRLLVLVDSRVVLGAVSKGRSNSRKLNFALRRQGFWCLAHDIALELVWMPTWANLAEIESWYAPLPKLSSSSRQPVPFRSRICSVNCCRRRAQTAEERLQKLESSGAFSCSVMTPARV